MKIMVTGGAGFIGSNLCRMLAARPDVDEVVVVDDLSTGFEENLVGVPVAITGSSILDVKALDATVEGADSIVHLGARGSVPRSVADPLASHTANATGTATVLEAARRAGNVHVVMASSSSVYGANTQLPKVESMVTRPVSPYAATKLATESYTLAWQHTDGMPTLAFRYFNVFGPRQAAGHVYAAVVPAFVSAATEGRRLPVHGDGTQSRDFTYVDTVCEVLTDAAIRRVSHPEPVNLAFGTRTDLLDVIATLESILDRELPVEHLATRAGDVRHTQAANDVLLSLFPYVEPVGLRPGLEATVEWFDSQT